jgi:SEC-C motif-containing protein
MFEKCPCGSGKMYLKCCKPYIKGKANPPTAEALMRSRYSAYVRHEIDYIINTCIDGDRIDHKSVTDWSEKSQWLGLRIINSARGGGEGDNTGTVAFEAVYIRGNNLRNVHHELANFEKKDGKWFYKNGEIISEPVVRVGEKVGRNDPCPCRSGKKYKHCCGKN